MAANLTGTGVNGAGLLYKPYGVAIDPEGHLWIADGLADEVDEFEPSGAFIRSFGKEGSGSGQFLSPVGLAVDPRGDLWVADMGNSRVEEFDSEGRYLTQFASSASGEGQLTLSNVSGVAVGPKLALTCILV